MFPGFQPTPLSKRIPGIETMPAPTPNDIRCFGVKLSNGELSHPLDIFRDINQAKAVAQVENGTVVQFL